MIHYNKNFIQFCVVFFLISCNSEQEERPETELVSHRGGMNSGLAENSIDSFYRAINNGFDSIETDLRILNGEVVLSHDSVIDSQDYATLAELLQFSANNQVRLWLEIKDPRVIAPTVELLKYYQITDVVIASFKLEDLIDFRLLAPEFETGLIMGSFPKGFQHSVGYEWVILNKNAIKANYHSIKDYKIATWTIGHQRQYNRIKGYVDAVISDISLVD